MLKIIVVKQEVFFQYILMTFLEEILALNLEIKNPTTFFIMYFILFRNKLKKPQTTHNIQVMNQWTVLLGFFSFHKKTLYVGLEALCLWKYRIVIYTSRSMNCWTEPLKITSFPITMLSGLPSTNYPPISLT